MAQKKCEKLSKKQFKEIVEYSVHYNFCYCYLCGEPITPGQKWNLDHVHPRSKGGKTDPSNLRPTHYDCNQAKADMSLARFRQMQRALLDEERHR